jgi:hypothetical protein
MANNNAPRDSNLLPGYDEENPYEGEDISTYPKWWRRSIEQFREYGLRPYRPPRFDDGELTPPVIKRLESEYGVDIFFRVFNPQKGKQWGIFVDGELVSEIERERLGEGYSLYKLSSDEFRDLVRNAIGET